MVIFRLFCLLCGIFAPDLFAQAIPHLLDLGRLRDLIPRLSQGDFERKVKVKKEKSTLC